ncbi:general stress protein 20U [Siminovitchia terrae]|uniref:DNA starvation/stationary phase protection protein n=1 Tax=Siminovitchia terrae TaxID=1914933 RepID=A0A429X154_SIMTE|nr:Dps family protein [Siminovitchia terrae]RST57147.1 DNA starvation/stationary phase protection protein [Siminovitchia terrae]GIN93121.1 general stress protein 20U [Siminovitchia terrae]GIN98856.1 general stress protein 20U [Siminovitchia terrae]
MSTESQQLIELVNKQVANWTVLYTKLHNFHWYVKGPNFFTLHAKFEELYNEAALHVDELAERLLALGGEPVATLRESLELASVNEAGNGQTAEQMVQTIVEDFEILTLELKKGIELADQSGDETTGDMLLSIHQSLEKHLWMLNAFLGEKVQ